MRFVKGSCEKHETLCDVVEDRLKNMGLITQQHVMYKDRGRDGEVDVLGFNERYLLLCEIKSSDKPKNLIQGEKQLYRAESRYDTRNHTRRIFKILAYYNNNNDPVYEWII